MKLPIHPSYDELLASLKGAAESLREVKEELHKKDLLLELHQRQNEALTGVLWLMKLKLPVENQPLVEQLLANAKTIVGGSEA